MFRYFVHAFALSILVFPVAANANCHLTLSYLSRRLPSYSDPQLQSIRAQILRTNINSILRTAMSQGYSAQSAVAAARQQAQSFEQRMPQAEECVRRTSVNPALALSQLKHGHYQFNGAQGGMNDTCAKAYVAFYYGLVANRATASDIACLAQSMDR